MSWLIYFLAGGSTFFFGSLLLTFAIVIAPRASRWWARILLILAVVTAVVLIAISAAALPYWLYAAWAGGILTWVLTPKQSRGTRLINSVEAAALALTLFAVAFELSYEVRPSLPRSTIPRLYVLGDSISAGLDADRDHTWPTILRNERDIQVVDLSRPGSTIAMAIPRVRSAQITSGLVLISSWVVTI
jgi:hypothetical protein